ncbi:hypothetical protein [Actinoplanes sp. NPDC023714]|uniref:hypothetical protein n=1 Tax=Actinoplanes sp. NPDC023714 TaxID=3154322 RepID=UPI0033EF5146
MSYDQLAQHAIQLERSAVIMDMRQRGFGYDSDENRFWDSFMDDEVVRSAADLTAAKFSGVADLFTPFLGMPDPEAFIPLRDVLAQAATTLNHEKGELPYNAASVLTNPDLGLMDDVKGLVKDWYGEAGHKFKSDYLSKWDSITSNQFALVIALKGGIEAEHALWREARKNVDDLAHQAQASLDSMLDCNPKDVAFLLTVAGSIFAVGASVSTGGLAIGLTIVGEAFASGAAVPMADKEKVTFSGRNAGEIVNGIRDALAKLSAQIVAAETVIRDAMDNALGVLHQNPDRIIAPRPGLADATAATIRDDVLGLGTAEG